MQDAADLRDPRPHGRSLVRMDDRDRALLAAAADIVSDATRLGKVVLWLVAPASLVSAIVGVIQLVHH